MGPVLVIALASAGAITTANKMGVSNGTRISRGVCALRLNRRRASVANPASGEVGARGPAAGDCLWVLGVVTTVVDIEVVPFELREIQAARRVPVRRR